MTLRLVHSKPAPTVPTRDLVDTINRTRRFHTLDGNADFREALNELAARAEKADLYKAEAEEASAKMARMRLLVDKMRDDFEHLKRALRGLNIYPPDESEAPGD